MKKDSNLITTLDLNNLELISKSFYEFKYSNKSLEHFQIPEIIIAIKNVKYFIDSLSEHKNPEINIEYYVKIKELFDKYYRSEYIQFIDRNSIEHYFQLNPFPEYDFNIKIELKHTPTSNKNYFNWLKTTHKKIKNYKKWNRWDFNFELELIKNHSIEEYLIPESQILINKYFNSLIKNLLFRIHAFLTLRDFKIVESQIKHEINSFEENLNVEIEAFDETKSEILKKYLIHFHFFELEKVKILSEQSKNSLIQFISENGLPYAIAMFDYLDFLKYLENKHFNTKAELNKTISIWFDKDKDGRSVKGNINVLNEYSNERRDRYTAHNHIKQVEKDYNELK